MGGGVEGVISSRIIGLVKVIFLIFLILLFIIFIIIIILILWRILSRRITGSIIRGDCRSGVSVLRDGWG